MPKILPSRETAALFKNRLVRATLLDSDVYRELADDTRAVYQAALAVALASLAGVAGHFTWPYIPFSLPDFLGEYTGWMLWAGMTYTVAVLVPVRGKREVGFTTFFRSVGFAASPGMLAVFAPIPGLNGVVYLVAYVWMLAAMIAAVRVVFGFDRVYLAAVVCVPGFPVKVLITAFMTMHF